MKRTDFSITRGTNEDGSDNQIELVVRYEVVPGYRQTYDSPGMPSYINILSIRDFDANEVELTLEEHDQCIAACEGDEEDFPEDPYNG